MIKSIRLLTLWTVLTVAFLTTGVAHAATAKSLFVAGHSTFQTLMRNESMAADRTNWEEVIRNFSKCYEADSESPYAPKAVYYLGRTYDELGRKHGNDADCRLALKFYGRFVYNYPDHGWAADCLYRRANLFAQVGDKDRAVFEFWRIVNEYSHSDKKDAAMAAISGGNNQRGGAVRRTNEAREAPAEAPQNFSAVSLDRSSGEKPSPEDLYAGLNDSVYMIIAINDRKRTSQGSGVAVTDRIMISNHHVIRGMDAFGYVRGEDAVLLKAISGSKKKDILVAKSSKTLKPICGFRSFDSLKIGEKVYTLGSPESWNNTFSEGIVSGLRTWGGLRYVQTTAPISHGSSGGGLFDAYGRLIGITTLSHKEGQNLNLAISVDEYMPYLSNFLH